MGDQKLPRGLDWAELEALPASMWARFELNKIRELVLEQALDQAEARDENEGLASARAVASLRVKIQRYEQFLLEHSAKAGDMDAKEWARKLIQEGLHFWGQVSATALWGEFYFCKMIGLSSDVEEVEGEKDEETEDD